MTPELPNSELGKAIRYVQSNWVALTRYVDVGRLSIDNNAAHAASGTSRMMPTVGLCRVGVTNRAPAAVNPWLSSWGKSA